MDSLIAYDIAISTPSDQRRLAKVARICEGYGVRVQKSVFECRLTSEAHERLVGDLLDAIDPAVDSVRIYRFLGQIDMARTTLGRDAPVLPERPWIV